MGIVEAKKFIKEYPDNYICMVWQELVDEGVEDESIYMEEVDRCKYDGKLTGQDLLELEKFTKTIHI